MTLSRLFNSSARELRDYAIEVYELSREEAEMFARIVLDDDSISEETAVRSARSRVAHSKKQA